VAVAVKRATIPKTRRAISPFRNTIELENEITKFMNIHKASFSNHASRVSDYFEMCCFNYIVRFYKDKGYITTVENLQAGKYRYKCSTQGNQTNFSHFKISKKLFGEIHEFEIQHNLAIESFHEEFIYTTPDISIVKVNSIQENLNHYGGRKKLSFVSNKDVVTFCEAKQFIPFPELMFNFIGIVNELSNEIMHQKQLSTRPLQIAPTLMISGKPNAHADRIKKSLESRYCINILYDVFSKANNPFKKYNISYIKTITAHNDDSYFF
jgi:hypothetical protein